MAYKRNGYTAHDGDKTRKTPRRMRAEHKVIKKSRYKGDDLGEKINDVEDRIEFLMEDANGNTNNPRKARQQEKAIAKLKKRRDQYRAEYKRLNEAN
tara:strand:- start:16 stop:306 length:291 start_codon:yes stop_codon:yes gene_type:complete